jgi:hypothetical protein
MPQELISLRKIKDYDELRCLPKQYRDPIIELIAEVRLQAFKDSIKDLKGAENLTEMQIKILAMSTDAVIHIRRDGKINVNGYFNCSGLGLTSLHGLKFGKVKGDFICHSNSITNLDGFPTENQKRPCDFYRNQGVSPRTLSAIHEIMIKEGLDYWLALCRVKSQMEAGEWDKLSVGIDSNLSDDTIKGASMLGRFFNP